MGVQWTEENNFTGIEYGSYFKSAKHIEISTEVNHDVEALLCNVTALGNCSNSRYNARLAGHVFTLTVENEATAKFDRIDLDYDQITGVWELEGDNAMLVFLPNNRYFGIQWKEENNFVGFERGTFSFDGQQIIVNVIQNNDGEALVCNEIGSPQDNCQGLRFDAQLISDESGSKRQLRITFEEEAVTFKRADIL